MIATIELCKNIENNYMMGKKMDLQPSVIQNRDGYQHFDNFYVLDEYSNKVNIVNTYCHSSMHEYNRFLFVGEKHKNINKRI